MTTVSCNDVLVIAIDTLGWQGSGNTGRWFKALVFPAPVMERGIAKAKRVKQTTLRLK